MKPRAPRLRIFDYIAFALAAGLIAASAVMAYSTGSAASRLHVRTVDGDFVYDLAADAVLDFEGPIGTTRVKIENGTARVVSSPCREQLCVNTGALDAGGDWAACLPNRVFLEVTGDEESSVDALSY